jgi:hypothetical protein
MRREFSLPAASTREPRLRATYSGATEIYLNGVLACRLSGGVRGYENLTVSPEALATLKPGPNLLAVHSRVPAAPKSPARMHVDAALIDLAPGDTRR